MRAAPLEMAGQVPRIETPRSGGKRASAGTTVLPLHGPMSPLRGWETPELTTWEHPPHSFSTRCSVSAWVAHAPAGVLPTLCRNLGQK